VIIKAKNAQIGSKNEVLLGDSLRFSHLNLLYQYIGMMMAALIPAEVSALLLYKNHKDAGVS